MSVASTLNPRWQYSNTIKLWIQEHISLHKNNERLGMTFLYLQKGVHTSALYLYTGNF